MRYLVYLMILVLIACNPQIKQDKANDTHFAGGKEYGTGKLIKPKVFEFGEYSFICGYSDTAASLAGYYKDKEFIFKTNVDGYFDSVAKVDIGNDTFPDFLVFINYEDGTDLVALTSMTNGQFGEVQVGECSDTYCILNGDTMKSLQPPILLDIDGDGKKEIILRTAKINNRLISTSCSDTFYFR